MGTTKFYEYIIEEIDDFHLIYEKIGDVKERDSNEIDKKSIHKTIKNYKHSLLELHKRYDFEIKSFLN